MLSVLDGVSFADPTALTKHPCFDPFAVDQKGRTTAVAVNKFIHMVSLSSDTDRTQCEILAVSAFGRWGCLALEFLYLLKVSL